MNLRILETNGIFEIDSQWSRLIEMNLRFRWKTFSQIKSQAYINIRKSCIRLIKDMILAIFLGVSQVISYPHFRNPLNSVARHVMQEYSPRFSHGIGFSQKFLEYIYDSSRNRGPEDFLSVGRIPWYWKISNFQRCEILKNLEIARRFLCNEFYTICLKRLEDQNLCTFHMKNKIMGTVHVS